MSKSKKRLLIIDGNALVHRSFHALPPTMSTKDGEPTNAVYGFALVFLKAVSEFRPDYVALTLDVKGPTFRHAKYAAYKGTRAKAPDELYAQIPRVKELARAFGVPVYEKSGYEADDLIGTITAMTDGNIEKIIVTGDLDALQLVDDETKVYTMSRGIKDSVLYDEAAVIGRFGLAPAQMVDYKALRGDPSDNIPGVRGIGEKTAAELLRAHETLDGVYSYLDKKVKGESAGSLKPRLAELLRAYKDDAYMSRELAAIKRDVPIDFDLGRAEFGRFSPGPAIELLSRLEFKSLLPRVHGLISGRASRQSEEDREKAAADKFERNRRDFNYRLVGEERAFKRFLALLRKQRRFAFDTETSSFDPLTADLLGISFAWKAGEAYFVNIGAKGFAAGAENNVGLFGQEPKTSARGGAGENRKPHPWIEALSPIFADERIEKYGHNIKFDMMVMQSAGVDVKGAAFDTMIASYLLNPGSRQHNLDALTFAELGFEKISKNDLLGKGKGRLPFGQVDTDKLMLYSCEDADFTRRLVVKLAPKLKAQKLQKLFAEIEMPLVKVLARMEAVGVRVEAKALAATKKKLEARIDKLAKKIHKLAGVDFNINSTQQLREILFTKLGIPAMTVSRKKTGLSTAAEELDKLKDLHPIIPLIQEHRELVKLATTYVDALPEMINRRTGRLHTSFNQTITATGRLSSTEPNLQNIPVRTEDGREIRKAFVAAPGCRLLSLDYSQIELRLAAHMSGDRKMIAAFKRKEDIHTATAAEINRVPPEKVTPAMRREAKAVNFGILYGQGPHGLSRTADIPYARAKDFIDQYFNVYKGVKEYIEDSIKAARSSGYAATLFGRRRFLPELESSVVQIRKAAERMAVNTPLQGTAADMIKAAMIKVDAHLRERYPAGDRVRMILQVHDELLFEADQDEVGRAAAEIRTIMEGVVKLKVPVVVDAKAGDNWGEMEKLEAKSKK